jgi:two-component system sensor histidine kinase ChiS
MDNKVLQLEKQLPPAKKNLRNGNKYLVLIGGLITFISFTTACGGLIPTNLTEPSPTLSVSATLDVQSSVESSLKASVITQHTRDNDIRFEHLSLEQGLSQSVVTCIVQDSQGFMWFGTQDGLNRYDGYEFKVYGYDQEAPDGLSSRWITALYEDDAGALWIGIFDGGLNRYDRETGQFIHYKNDPDDPHSLSNNNVAAIYQDREGALWVATGVGLNQFDQDTGRFTRYLHDPEDVDSLSDNIVTALYQDREGVLWVGTATGLESLDQETGQFTHYKNDPDDVYSLSDDGIQAIYQDQEGVLWVGTAEGGLNRFDRETGQFIRYQNDPDDPRSLTDDNVQVIYQGQDGTLWIGTGSGGLDRLDSETQQFIHYRNDTSDPNSINSGNILSIYQDREGLFWIGTFGSGINRFDPSAERFVHYHHISDDANSLSDDLVWSIRQDREGLFWFGTAAGGLNRFDPNTGRWYAYRNNPADVHSLSSDDVFAIQEDSEGALWVGTLGGGLNRFDRETEQFVRYQNDPDDLHSLSSNAILALYEDSEGVLWIGTGGNGLDRFDREKEQFIHYENDPDDPYSLNGVSVATIYQDQEGVLWAGTFAAGINRFDREKEWFTHYQNDSEDSSSLSDNTVLSIYQDRAGVLWFGTSGGLNRFDRASETFTAYIKKDGLPNEVIYGILEDDQGNLWLSTNRGISRFNPRTETFKNYDARDGLQSDEFNQGAYFKSRDGEMFFGGINGFNAFYPENIRDNVYVPPVVLTSLTQGGEEVAIAGELDSADEITFKWPNTFFEFEFSALSYMQSEENQYAYKLEGFEQNWNEMGTRRFGRYTNIPGGTYTLRVIGSNNDDVWNEQGAAVNVTVVPPFWQTWWFRGLAIVLVVGGTLGAFAVRLRVAEAHRQELEIEVDARTRELQETLVALEQSKEAAEAANRAKSIFLTNMSHELRTPLNAVLGLAQLMTRDANLTSLQQTNLGIINRSGEHLLGLINEVLELSKIEAGRITLNESDFDLYRLLDGLEEMFRMRAEQKGLVLTLQRVPDVPQYVYMDEGKLRQVLMNLLGNAVKFTEKGGITLRVWREEYGVEDTENTPLLPASCCTLHFEVEDTGPGIAAEELTTMFAPFEQTESGRQSLEGTGLGLPISQQYVRLMGGELTVRSPLKRSDLVEEGGSAFSFALPVALAEVSVVRTARPLRRVVGLEPGQPIYRLLIVEDNWANRRLLTQLLGSLGEPPLGFEVREAINGKEGIEIWEEWAPHLIFMDMRMPVMDGYEATRQIKATIKGQATVIIALTASALEEDRSVILSEGCDAFIRKPFREEQLFDALSKHLGVRFVYQELSSTDVSQSNRTSYDASPDSLLAAVTAMPSDWLSDLRQAATRADWERLINLIKQISERDPALADALAKLANNFDYDGILACTSAHSRTTDMQEDKPDG